MSLASQTIVKLRKEINDLQQTREDAIKEFNESFGHEHFELKQPYTYSEEKTPRFAPRGLKSAIEADVVVANIGDSVDFQTLLKQMEEKYA